MSYTNQTPNYHLPQYIGTDIPNPLTDFNGAMETIDSALKDIGDAQATASLDIADIKAQNGDAALETSAQTLSEAINELKQAEDVLASRATSLETRMTSAESELASATVNITTLANKIASDEQKIGTATLHTVAQNLSDAVNELKDESVVTDANFERRITALESVTTSVDDAMSDSSTNAVQNKVIKQYVDDAVSDVIDGDTPIDYDNTTSGASATTVQGALDEAFDGIDTAKGETRSATLSAGSTNMTLTFQNVTIGADTLIDVYTDTFGVNPTNVTYTATTVTLTFKAQSAAVKVGVHVANI